MQSSLHVTVKNAISLLESTSSLTLDVAKARLLVTFYEIGHGIEPGASISIATAAKTARMLGLNKRPFQQPLADPAARIIAEEEKRVWWATDNIDRFINMCNGDAVFATEDPKLNDELPIDEALSVGVPSPTSLLLLLTPEQIISVTESPTFGTPSGRVIRHVFDPVSDADFRAKEALQVERTLMAFISLLVEEHTKYGMCCGAYGMCCCALFILYDSALLNIPGDAGPQYKSGIFSSLDIASTRIAEFSACFFGDAEVVDNSTYCPFVPFSLYLAGNFQYRFWKQNGEQRHKDSLNSLKMVLGYENKRWLWGGKYLNALVNLECDWPSTIMPIHGSYVKATTCTFESG